MESRRAGYKIRKFNRSKAQRFKGKKAAHLSLRGGHLTDEAQMGFALRVRNDDFSLSLRGAKRRSNLSTRKRIASPYGDSQWRYRKRKKNVRFD